METNRGLTIKDILIRLILIIIFIFLLIWLFPMPDLKPLNNQIFADNIDRMKDVAKSYYTLERLPKNINDSKKMTLREMIDNHLILPLTDSNGKYCSRDDSYVEITKLENEYIIKVNLSCTDKQDYIIEHYGCYDICSDKCKMLETTAKSGYAGDIKKTSKKKTTYTGKITTKRADKIYEYQFVKNECTEKFDRYVCQSGYYLAGDTCVKNGSKVVRVDAKKHIANVTSTDTKAAKAVTDSSTKLEDASCRNEYLTSTINAGYKKTTYTAEKRTVTETITANKTYSYDVKAAIQTTKKTESSYKVVQNYDVITADKYSTGTKWEYVSTIVDRNPGLAYVNDNEKVILVDQWQELYCPGATACDVTVTYYKYYKYNKVSTGYSYSCDAYPGYTLYDGNKCRKQSGTPSKYCPSGYSDTGSGCVKYETSLSCSKYGSSYELNKSNKTCVKTNTSYSCPSGSTKTSNPKYCNRTKTTYVCPAGTESIGDNKCVKYHDYYCPANTSSKTYTLNGTKCTVKTRVKVCSCPAGTVQTEDKLHCAKTSTVTKYTCSDYPGYTLNGNKCTKTTTTQKVTYSCDSGYNLDGTTCFKTVSTSDSKKAEKTYKTVCDQKYKWSTKTSIEGWQYTGNKRLLN